MVIGINRSEVACFLKQVKALTAQGSFDLVWTKKNKETILNMGLTGIKEIKQFVLQLSVEDYVAGPLPDHDVARKEPVWIFSPQIGTIPMYVKLKVVHSQVKCLSFHEAEKPVTVFPFEPRM